MCVCVMAACLTTQRGVCVRQEGPSLCVCEEVCVPENKSQAGNSRCMSTREVGFVRGLRAQPISSLEGGRPQNRQALPSGHLGQNLCFLWPFPPDGKGMASGIVVGGVGTSHLLSLDEQEPSLPPVPAPCRPWPGAIGNGEPLAACEGVQQKLEEREVGGGVGGSFLSFFLLPHPQHTHECVPATSLPPSCLTAIPSPRKGRVPRRSLNPAWRSSPTPAGGKGRRSHPSLKEAEMLKI